MSARFALRHIFVALLLEKAKAHPSSSPDTKGYLRILKPRQLTFKKPTNYTHLIYTETTKTIKTTGKASGKTELPDEHRQAFEVSGGLRLRERPGVQAAQRLREALGVVRAAASRRGGSGQAWQGWAWCSSLGMPRMRAREFK